MTRPYRRISALAGIAAFAASVPLSAALGQPASIQERARGAQRVVVASVADTTANYQRNQFGDNLIVTHARLAVEETIKRTVQPYFVLDGNVCALLAAKDHVNVFLYDGGIVPMFRQIIANNRAGGWRKLKDQAGHIQSDRPARGSASWTPGGG